MSKRTIAAIPTFNAGSHVIRLVKQLMDEQFNRIYVLDDASTDGSVRAVADEYPEAMIIRGAVNIGAAGNRNRLLQYIDDEYVLFIDADMQLPGDGHLRKHVEKALRSRRSGLVGGLLYAKSGTPMDWNYGHEMHPVRDAWFWYRFCELRDGNSSKARLNQIVVDLHQESMDYAWIMPESLQLKTRAVDWVAEGLFAVKAEVFRSVGGYDEAMRHHEGQDLARRVRDAGHEVRFDPVFSATHLEWSVRGKRRESDYREAQFYFYQKHWGMSREVFEKLSKF